MSLTNLYNYMRLEDDATITPVINGGVLYSNKKVNLKKYIFLNLC